MESTHGIAIVQQPELKAREVATMDILLVEMMALLLISAVAVLEIRQRKRAEGRRSLRAYSRWRGLPE